MMHGSVAHTSAGEHNGHEELKCAGGTLTESCCLCPKICFLGCLLDLRYFLFYCTVKTKLTAGLIVTNQLFLS